MPLAMGYIYLASQKKEVLAVGDDLGVLHVYTMRDKWHMCDYQTLKDKCLSCHSAELEAKREKLMSSIDSAKKSAKVLVIQHLDRVEIKGLRLHQGWITRVLIIEDLDSIVTSSLDGFVHFHGIEDHKYRRTFKLHQKGINALVWSKSNRFFASCGEERNM
jgi:WD40 repeat protein